jgi:hypothetical protein
MAFDVVDEPVDTADPSWNRIPTTLVGSEVMNLQESQATRTRRFRVKRENGTWTIDGVTWADVIASNYRKVAAEVPLGATEIWEFENGSGGWFHPMHIHLVDFKVLSRNGRAPFAYEKGPKDTVYVGENETVRLLVKFGPHEGRYMVHCHNLVHEDHDMMVQFRVGEPGDPDPNDPMTAAPAVPSGTTATVPEPAPTPSATPSATSAPAPTPTPTPTPSSTPSPASTPSPSSTPTPTPTKTSGRTQPKRQRPNG